MHKKVLFFFVFVFLIKTLIHLSGLTHFLTFQLLISGLVDSATLRKMLSFMSLSEPLKISFRFLHSDKYHNCGPFTKSINSL